MAFSEDFLRFLKTNYPDDYLRASVHDVAEDVKQAIYSRFETKYKIWEHVPEWIKQKYADRLPRDLMNGNVTVKNFVKHEEEVRFKDEKETAKVANYSIKLLALGYAAETASVLASNYALRTELMQKAQNGVLSPAQMEEWRRTRESDREAILEDWRKYQKEKYLVHLLKEMERNDRRARRAKSENEQVSCGMKKSAMERELNGCIGNFSDRKNQKKLLDYLKNPAQRKALAYVSPEIMEVFVNFLDKEGIKANLSDEKLIEFKRMNLFEEMKKHFVKRKNLEQVLCNKYKQQNEDFAHTPKNEIPEKIENKNVKKLDPRVKLNLDDYEK